MTPEEKAARIQELKFAREVLRTRLKEIRVELRQLGQVERAARYAQPRN